MSVVLTVPAVEAVLLFERRPVLSAAESVYGTPSGTVPLAEWATADDEPMVDEPEPRPLQPGDRVEIVAGELPSPADCGLIVNNEWMLVEDYEGGNWRWEHARGRGEPAEIDLPAPGTVLGTATVEWVGPIRMEPPAGPTRDAVTIDGDGRAWRFARQLDHEHCDWTPGRWAVRLTDTEAAK